MNMFTKEEVEDIEVVYRAFCGDGRVLTDLELSIMKKLKAWVEQLPAPMNRVSLEEFKKDYPDVLHGT
jgi:hypothetical protein